MLVTCSVTILSNIIIQLLMSIAYYPLNIYTAGLCMRLIAFVCVCVCVCVCVTKKTSIYTLTGQMSSRKGHIVITHPLYILPEMFLVLFSHTEGAIPLISIHVIVPQGSLVIFRNMVREICIVLRLSRPLSGLIPSSQPKRVSALKLQYCMNSLYSIIH